MHADWHQVSAHAQALPQKQSSELHNGVEGLLGLKPCCMRPMVATMTSARTWVAEECMACRTPNVTATSQLV